MTNLRRFGIFTAALFALLLGASSAPQVHRAEAAPIAIQEIAPGTSSPVSIVNAGDGSNRLFIVEQTGRIRVYDTNTSTLLATPFLDLSALVVFGGEQGLLNIVFHPDYGANGHFYVYYTNTTSNLVLARYTVSANPNIANAATAQILLTIPHPGQTNHNGGGLAFDDNGLLYVAVGDGGGVGDPNNNAQNINVLLGKLLRLDVDSASPYAIPASNPFAGVIPGRDEIWAFGLRNPWRISTDRLTGDLLIGDVGQGQREEVDFQLDGAVGGANYGWRLKEGTLCYNPSSGCDPGGLTGPIFEYSHAGGACSITGGYRYRGAAPALAGTYVYGDFCTGEIWGATQSGPSWTPAFLLDTGVFISSFGEDEAGELYFTDSIGSKVYRIIADQDGDDDGIDDASDNCVSVPNAGQENADRNFIDLSPPKTFDDLTWPNADVLGDACDTDADNDRLANAVESVFPVAGCPSATGPLNPLLRDTDGDLVLDGAECLFGTDPLSAASVPPMAVLPDADNDRLPDGLEALFGSNMNDLDSDDDGVLDGVEVRFYNSNPVLANTDGDICADGREVASINSDTAVNAIDLSQVAQAFGDYTPPGTPVQMDFDINKDTQINAIDLSQVAQRFGIC